MSFHRVLNHHSGQTPLSMNIRTVNLPLFLCFTSNSYHTLHFVASASSSSVVPVPGTFSWPLVPRGKPRRGMLRRAVFSDLQRKALERTFQKQKYISKPDRKKLASKLGLKDSQVHIVAKAIPCLWLIVIFLFTHPRTSLRADLLHWWKHLKINSLQTKIFFLYHLFINCAWTCN